ncbi:hypothetical protein HPB48_002151 [Haemaphysalis longicornis]|uniref:Uncharacterized protein n=1 Tax=Haemaphysalis longicornis TaxID=44386 RepID=A0A9J6FGQ8_HAELO|nr:hypothetical protein HPB48_002151 [Haemaphysalis longicornis]
MPATKPPPRTSPGRPVSQDSAIPTYAQTFDINSWIETLKADINACTTQAPNTETAPNPDVHMVHLLEALASLTRRWKKQRYSRRLHLRITQLKQDVEKYAQHLQNSCWQTVCDSLHNGTSLKRTWNLLRHLIDPTTTKAETASRGTQPIELPPKSPRHPA